MKKILFITIFIATTVFLYCQSISSHSDKILNYIANGYILHSVENLKKLSATNDIISQFYLAECYEHGIGVEKNHLEAFRLYRITAERGLPDGMLKLSDFYGKIETEYYNPTKSLEWKNRFLNKGGRTRLKSLMDYYILGKNYTNNFSLNPNLINNEDKPNDNSLLVQDNSIALNNIKNFNAPESDTEQKIEEIISDVDASVPENELNNCKIFALIIANENYKRVSDVPFAKKDGTSVKTYIHKTLGVPYEQISLVENATLNDIQYQIARLTKISEIYNSDCSFIVYYCGHGISNEKNGDGYLLPIDGYGNDISTGYSLIKLYNQLGNLKSKKTILFTDACFSGTGKEGNMLVAARGIAIKANPNEATGNLIAFSACQGDETAYSYNEKEHGLLTYFLLKKLQETSGKVTLGELEEYIMDNVSKTAIIKNGKSQTPSISVSPNLLSTWREETLLE